MATRRIFFCVGRDQSAFFFPATTESRQLGFPRGTAFLLSPQSYYYLMSLLKEKLFSGKGKLFVAVTIPPGIGSFRIGSCGIHDYSTLSCAHGFTQIEQVFKAYYLFYVPFQRFLFKLILTDLFILKRIFNNKLFQIA